MLIQNDNINDNWRKQEYNLEEGTIPISKGITNDDYANNHWFSTSAYPGWSEDLDEQPYPGNQDGPKVLYDIIHGVYN